MDELKIWVDRYVEEFNEPFPVFELAGVPEAEKIALIKEALDKNTPIEFEHEEDKLY